MKYGSKTANCTIIVEKSESDWAKIAKIAKEIAEGRTTETVNDRSTQATVTVDGNEETIKVGDLFYVKHNGVLRKVRVMGFKHDTLTDSIAAYGERTTATKAGISFEFTEFMIDSGGQITSSNSNENGWAATTLRAWLEGTEGIEKISEVCRTNIKQVNKLYIKTYYDANSVTNSSDKLWLLSCSEIWSRGRSDLSGTRYGQAIGYEGKQYKWYVDHENGINPKNMNTNYIKRTTASTAMPWWLRSPRFDSAQTFCNVLANGISGNDSVGNGSSYISPGFCI